MQTKILIVDDEKLIRESLADALEDDQFVIEIEEDGEKAMLRMKEAIPSFNIVITDVKMSMVSGFQLLQWIRESYPQVDVIIITGYGTVEDAVRAIKEGAYEYIIKPINLFQLRNIIANIIKKQRLIAENFALKKRFNTMEQYRTIGTSRAIQNVYDTVVRVADTDATVLIQGESGTGKEVVAGAIHNRSSRRNKPFVVVNCAALPASLLENELFGHEREAFTGALSLKKGKFEQANSGTVFLDEITEMSLESQSGFLRVLEDRYFHRVGGSEVIHVDIRVIAASNRNVLRVCEDGKFRYDLYYRLNVVPIYIPPLRQRKEDISALAQSFLSEFSAKYNRMDLEFSPEIYDRLIEYTWPGNVRELRNSIERAVIICRGKKITIDHFPEVIQGTVSIPSQTGDEIKIGSTLRDMENMLIEKTLQQVSGHRKKAAELLGISVRTLQYKIKEYNIKL